MENVFNFLRSIPLFSGVNHDFLDKMVSATRFHFLKYLPGETVAEAGERCTHIKFIIKGAVRSTLVNNTARFRVAQTITAPEVLAPDYLFGRTTRYPSTIVAIDDVAVMQIEKNEYVRLLMSEPILLYNYLNLVSTGAQKGVEGILALTSGSLEERIAFWLLTLSRPCGTDIVLTCRQRDLYSMFGVPRSSFFATLDSLAARGLITYGGDEIKVVSRKMLATILTNDSDN